MGGGEGGRPGGGQLPVTSHLIWRRGVRHAAPFAGRGHSRDAANSAGVPSLPLLSLTTAAAA